MYNDTKELEGIVRTFVAENGIDLQYYKRTFADRYHKGKPVENVDDIIYYFVSHYGRSWKHGHYLDAEAAAQYKPELKSWIYQHQLREYFESLGCFLPTPPDALLADKIVTKEEVRCIFLAWYEKHHSSPLKDYCAEFSHAFWNHEQVDDEQIIVNYFVNTAYRPWKTKWMYEQELRCYFDDMSYMFELMANID